jgi:hypothetical protein
LAPIPVFAADVSETGASGSSGATGTVGQPGGNGQGAAVLLNNSDFLNTAIATGGQGGSGGVSLLLFVPGGNGGAGGNASVQQKSSNFPIPEFESEVGEATIAATGGDGGNGGGLIPGNGGAGGAADALSNVDVATGGPEGAILQTTAVSGTGGNGGAGRNGGAGGAGTAVGTLIGQSNGSSVLTNAQGGAGGAAIINGGRGGDANATSFYSGGGQPADQFVRAEAVGGNGGNSMLGLNGDGGNAVADASGRHGSRDLGVRVTANARGGDSGTYTLPFVLQGNGGTAFASAAAESSNFPVTARADARAQGGNGVFRGGDALASASVRGPFAGAQALAAGGAGQQAGAAIATAVTHDDYYGVIDSSATATSADKFVRSVTVNASVFQDFDAESTVAATVFSQARAGDTSAIAALAPTPTVESGVVARAAAGPTAAEVAASLAGNPVIAAQAAAGSVWGLVDFTPVIESGEDGAVNPYDSIGATAAFTFDVSQRAPSNLWLGLLDASLPADAIGNFHFSLAGEGSTLFERDFSGSDFLTYFDDRLFDLGDWSGLVSSDGLFDLAVTFSGGAQEMVPEIRFAFGDTVEGSSAVPEPSALAMLLTGLLGIAVARCSRLVRSAEAKC